MITDLSFGILASQTYNKFASVSILLSSKFWKVILNNTFSIHLTPVGATLFFISLSIGLFEEKIIKTNRFLYYWVGSIFLFILVVAEGNMTLEYYQLFLIPVASIFCARFTLYLLDQLSPNLKAQMALTIIVFFFIGCSSLFLVAKRLKPVKYIRLLGYTIHLNFLIFVIIYKISFISGLTRLLHKFAIFFYLTYYHMLR